MIRLTVIALLLVLVIFDRGSAFQKNSHQNITQSVLNNNEYFDLDVLLKTKLGIIRGIDEPISHRLNYYSFLLQPVSAEAVVINGSFLEDDSFPTIRPLRHFHDALRDYGLWGEFDSAIIWSQYNVGDQDYSWNDARYYFYEALVSDNHFMRNKNFARTFRSVGQLMHLVEDMAVPEHTRNDGHPFSPGIESYIENKFFKNHSHFSIPLSNPFLFDFKTLQTTPSAFQNEGAPVPIANLFDTNVYTGSNPDVTVDNTVGLAEYTNANFLSIDTNPVSTTTSMPPYLSSTTPRVFDIPRPLFPDRTIKRWYHVKDRAGESNGGKGYKLTAMSVMNFYWYNIHGTIENISIPLLDAQVYEDYAQLLLPRAAGYAATLLKYFFRGDIELSLPDRTGTYALSTLEQGRFDTIRINARNVTPNDEEMPLGTVELVVKYKTALEDPFQGVPVPVSEDFTYLVLPEANGVTSIPRDEAIELVFDLSQNPIPFNATDLTLQVVYHGEMGFQTLSGFVGETDAVAVGFRDISEPTPVDYINSMDVVCVNDEILPAGSDKAVNTLDPDGNPISSYVDVYPHDLFDNYLKYSPRSNVTQASSSAYDVAVPFLPAGHYARHFVLTEPFGTFSVLSNQMQYRALDQRDDFLHWPQAADRLVEGIINQENYVDGFHTRYFSFMNDMRGIKFWSGVHWINQYYPSDSTCDEAESTITLRGPEPVEL